MGGFDNQREPMFNVPPAVLTFVILAIAIFVGQNVYLVGDARLSFLETFCFSPLRYKLLAAGAPIAGGWPAALWTPFTYSFIEVGLGNLVFDLLWLAIFGSAVAFRFGTTRFVLFAATASLIGAGLYTLIAGEQGVLLFGPTFVVSALLGGAARFMYQGGLAGAFAIGDERWKGRALGIVEMWSNVGVLQLFAFIAVSNALFSILYASSGLDTRAIVFNVLGYAVGILLFSFFDRRVE